MMGLSNGVHWVAWFIDSLTIMFCSIILLLIILWVSKIEIICCIVIFSCEELAS